MNRNLVIETINGANYAHFIKYTGTGAKYVTYNITTIEAARGRAAIESGNHYIIDCFVNSIM